MVREKFMTLNTFIRKKVRNTNNSLHFYLKKLEQESEIKTKGSIRAL